MKGEIAVRYTIRHFDLPLLTFEANMDSADTDLHIIKVYEENRSFLPLNLTVSEDGVERWLRHRTIPKNRAYVDALLSKVGLSLNRPLGIITVCKGLSLNDCFWVDAAKGFIAAYGIHADTYCVHIHFVICTVSFTTLNLFYSGYIVELRELEKIIQEWVFHFEEKLQRNPRLQQDREAALYGDDCIKYGNAPLTAKEQIKQNRRIKTK